MCCLAGLVLCSRGHTQRLGCPGREPVAGVGWCSSSRAICFPGCRFFAVGTTLWFVKEPCCSLNAGGLPAEPPHLRHLQATSPYPTRVPVLGAPSGSCCVLGTVELSMQGMPALGAQHMCMSCHVHHLALSEPSGSFAWQGTFCPQIGFCLSGLLHTTWQDFALFLCRCAPGRPSLGSQAPQGCLGTRGGSNHVPFKP